MNNHYCFMAYSHHWPMLALFTLCIYVSNTEQPRVNHRTENLGHYQKLLMNFYPNQVESNYFFLHCINGPQHLVQRRLSHFEWLPVATSISHPVIYLISLNFKLFECFPTCNLNTGKQKNISLDFGWKIHEFMRIDADIFFYITLCLHEPIPVLMAK